MPADDLPEIYGAQILGARKRQEDAFATSQIGNAVLGIVADGLGGHPAGDLASREALAAFDDAFRNSIEGGGKPGECMRDALLRANQHLLMLQQHDDEVVGMATTFVAAFLRAQRLSAVCVGDSYLLALRAGRMVRLNTLHSADGAITSAVGFHMTQMDVANEIEVEPGDRLLLATDGIAVLKETDIVRILGEAGDAGSAVRGLLSAIESQRNPGQDNATIVAIFV